MSDPRRRTTFESRCARHWHTTQHARASTSRGCANEPGISGRYGYKQRVARILGDAPGARRALWLTGTLHTVHLAGAIRHPGYLEPRHIPCRGLWPLKGRSLL